MTAATPPQREWPAGRRGPGARWRPPSRPNVVLPTSFPCLNKPRSRSSRKAGGCSQLKAPIPQAFSCIDQNRDGIICKADLRETYSQLGKVSVPEEELDAMLQEGKGPINFTVFLTLFGEKLNGTDPEEAILSAFRMFDPSGKGVVNKEEFKQLLLTQADKFSPAEVEQMFALTPMDLAGNIDYKSLCYIITHGDEKEE
ncbi:PREDICTED: myosin regulatory light chain 2, atrial isoform isoform X2 [Colobus angolensis palliatus]|uniref:myosin regulatory light chain 2, atrial isoform isoform X2 n=1 Tax=Colobus angolensis palliatus TaxID=336983 RepID=UPI0005F49009|nr:PREDICTED: myosin regulatory light chain 2, atrial isoform isoform X2 [Colobus angolensis palliatus]